MHACLLLYFICCVFVYAITTHARYRKYGLAIFTHFVEKNTAVSVVCAELIFRTANARHTAQPFLFCSSLRWQIFWASSSDGSQNYKQIRLEYSPLSKNVLFGFRRLSYSFLLNISWPVTYTAVVSDNLHHTLYFMHDKNNRKNNHVRLCGWHGSPFWQLFVQMGQRQKFFHMHRKSESLGSFTVIWLI